MSNANKQKGKYFENRVVKLLRESLELNDHECLRSPFSGNGEFEFGDIYFTNIKKYPIIIECKFGYDWTDSDFMPGLSKKLHNFVDQVSNSEKKYFQKMSSITDNSNLFTCVVLSKPYADPIVITKVDIDKDIFKIKTRYDDGFIFIYMLDDVLEYLKETYSDKKD